MTDITPFANRLGKNIKHLIKWAKRNHIEAWRIYDRDIPQFPFAIDVYGSHVHLQEYDTGWLMQPEEYETWLCGVLEAVGFVTGFAPEQIHLKRRERQKGTLQYEKTGKSGKDFTVSEHGRRFWVNLDKYLDTGLFLDHRNTRKKIGDSARGKRFLNLFSYTGSFTVYAATGGAVSSETVDLSNTYLDWAKRNFELNGVDSAAHRIVRADVFQYLKTAEAENKKFDLIVMDPPSFSNSKKMLDVLDIQRDQMTLIHGAMKLLASDGVMYFSNNLRSFELNPEAGEKYAVKDASKQSVPDDFRNKKIHQCWEIRHKQAFRRPDKP
ncbi:class I SAM-dependent methyltransferase [Neisseria iguanae]|uniref:SAM-dependent methyltransferase n=1 Tax=Neisseria iguanae TaxID=90242 RepID=A0A2P7U1L3_9NEIS|nr:class I SAM-dependent methyltransferase [Neisseria iguanae]PSJ80866.1 SAM-dependent methyltransferase [Neisseria iguanae]